MVSQTTKPEQSLDSLIHEVKYWTLQANTSAEAEQTFYTPVAFNPRKQVLFLAKNEAPQDDPHCINLMTMECSCPHCQERLIPLRAALKGRVIIESIYCKHGAMALMISADPSRLEDLPVAFVRVKAKVSVYSQDLLVKKNGFGSREAFESARERDF